MLWIILALVAGMFLGAGILFIGIGVGRGLAYRERLSPTNFNFGSEVDDA